MLRFSPPFDATPSSPAFRRRRRFRALLMVRFRRYARLSAALFLFSLFFACFFFFHRHALMLSLRRLNAAILPSSSEYAVLMSAVSRARYVTPPSDAC